MRGFGEIEYGTNISLTLRIVSFTLGLPPFKNHEWSEGEMVSPMKCVENLENMKWQEIGLRNLRSHIFLIIGLEWGKVILKTQNLILLEPLVLPTEIVG